MKTSNVYEKNVLIYLYKMNNKTRKYKTNILTEN